MIKKSGKLETLQDLRGIAAMIVLLFHASGLFKAYLNQTYAFGIFKQGYVGVDLFFVLSGFIITYIHMRDIGNPEKFKQFVFKRFMRIYPVCWAVLLPIAIAFMLIPSFGSENNITIDALLKSFLLFPQENHLITVLWSLCNELTFYLIFSILIHFKPKIAYTALTLWILGTALVSFNIVQIDIFALKSIFSPMNFEFLIGCVVAYLVNRRIFVSNYLILVGVVLLSLFWTVENLEIFKLQRVLAYGIPFAILVYGVVIQEVKYEKSYSNRVLRFLGDASYSIYLVHYPILSILNKVFAKLNLYNLFGSYIAMSLIILMTTIFGIIFYLIVERPIISFSKKLGNKLFIKPILVSEKTAELDKIAT
jgi:peptidoglycan/LPS O-acetylase OafA/YrhL